jgi:hypothetical protein
MRFRPQPATVIATIALTGKLSAAQISGKLSATQVSGKLPASQISGSLPGSQVSGTVASATSASAVSGQTFAKLNARAVNAGAAPLLSGFGGLTLACIGQSSGTSGTVMLQITNGSTNQATFSAGIISGASALNDQGAVPGAVAGTPTTTDFPFPVSSGSAEVDFSYKDVVGSTTNVVTGTFAVVIDNGCTAFGNAEAS